MPARVSTGAKPGAVTSMHPSPAFDVLRLEPSAEPDERVHVFSIGDTDYTMPAHPDATIALAYMEILAEDGEGAKADARAQVFLLRKMLGEDGYEALKNFEGLKLEHLAQLFTILYKHSMGALEAPKGQPASA